MSLLIGGKLFEEGSVPIDDRGYLLGDGLFETIPVEKGAPRFLDRHFARLRHGAEVVGIPLDFDMRDLNPALRELIAHNGVTEGVVRLTLTRGAGPRGYAPPQPSTPRWIAVVAPTEPTPERWYDEGIDLYPSTYRRDEVSPLTGVKSTSALDRVMAAQEYRSRGAHEGLSLDTTGRVSCCVAANIFWVREKKVYTPATACGALPGVTRGVIIEKAMEADIACAQVKEGPEALEEADEVFITNALVGVVPVRSITGWFGPKAPGEMTDRIAKLYRKARAAS